MRRAAAGGGRRCSCSAAGRSCASGRPARGRSTWRCTRARRARVDAPRGRSYVSAAPMTLALYNTLSRRVEPFTPLVPPRVTLYTCGPTVWNYAHIGNFRTFLFEGLLERGVAYKGEDGSIYFAIAKFPGYGRLSRLDTRELKIGARVASDEYAKDDPRDFALWKKANAADEQVGAAWDAPFGRGRPGWHLECSAMSLAEIGKCCGTETLDVHAGGVDLIFPHHEDEIAQSEAATGKPFARFWLHGEFLNVRGTKMSKRFGNFLTARDLRDQDVDAAAVRLLFWQTHYRKALDFTDDALAAAGAGVKRLGEFYERVKRETGNPKGLPDGREKRDGRLAELAAKFETDFRVALDDDLNAPRACAALFEFVHEGNAALDAGAPGAGVARDVLDRVMAVLDVLPTAKTVDSELARWIQDRIAARDKARKSKDFREADRIRVELAARGVEIEDTPSGTKWRLV